MLRLVFISIVFALGPAAQLAPQAAPEEQLTVRVTYDNDRSAPANLRVELLSVYGSSVATRTTDGFGSVVFTHLQPAMYKIRVSGDGVVTTEVGVDMGNSGPNSTQYVRVRKVASPTATAGVASVTDLDVPESAKKELDAAVDDMERKNWENAKTHLERAIKLYPKYALAYNNLGVTYLKLDSGEKAIECFRSALEFDQNLGQANVYLGQFYYDNKDYKTAEPYLARAASAEPQNPQVLMALANTELRNGEPDMALANAEKVHSLPDHGKFAIAHLIAAEVFSNRGDNQNVRKEYQQFLQEAPDSPLAPRVKDALSKVPKR